MSDNKILENYLSLKCPRNNDIDVPDKVPDDMFIFIDENNLEKDFCLEMINRFDKDHRKEKGLIGGGNVPRVDSSIKDTTEIAFSRLIEEHWINCDRILYDLLKKSIVKYLNSLSEYSVVIPPFLYDQSGFQIQKYEKQKGKYIWHCDSNILNKSSQRIITFIWYLNDVADGGETCFLHGKIKPTAGKLLLFPATWTYVHKGNMPISNDKYIITGWFCA